MPGVVAFHELIHGENMELVALVVILFTDHRWVLIEKIWAKDGERKPMSMSILQMAPRGRMYRGYPGMNVGDGNMGTGMLADPYDMDGNCGMLPRDVVAAAMQQPMPITALAATLANAPPEQERTICYP
ncbi:hypothetical protein Tco_0417271 [Tanacetum coccineum]